MSVFKMRAECLADVARALPALGEMGMLRQVTVTQPVAALPDVDVTFEHAGNLAWVRRALATLCDGHVMLETVALAADYTGERVEPAFVQRTVTSDAMWESFFATMGDG